MAKREISVRLINILILISFMFFYIKGPVFQQIGFYISVIYLIFLILKPYMLRQPLKSPVNFLFELADILFVFGVSFFVTPKALIPLGMFMLLRSSLLFSVYTVILNYVLILAYICMTNSTTDVLEIVNIAHYILMLVIPSCIVCIVKDDVISMDSKNKELSEKVRIKSAVIDELQKYSDMLFVGDHKKEDDMLRTDYVTQIPNRYHFEEVLKKGVDKSVDPSFNMSVAMVYINNLYQYRVKYSYSTEHLLIKRLHDLIAEQIKSNDFIARYEEDCIAVLMFNKDLEAANELAKHIYSSFEVLKYNEPELKELSLNIFTNDIENSIGDESSSLDVMKLLNKGKLVEFFTNSSIKE